MDYKKFLSVGEIISKEYTVQEGDTAHSIGNKGVEVLSTPALLKYIENGASSALFERLPEGYSPVGTHVTLNHIAATPIDGVIKVQAKVSSIEKNKVKYEFGVFYNEKLIADGIYEQAIINLDRFLNENR